MANASPVTDPARICTRDRLRELGVNRTRPIANHCALQNSLTLDDTTPATDRPKPPPGGPRRPMDRPPPRRGDKPQAPPDGVHRPTRSQEEALRARRMQAGGAPRPSPNSPQRKPQQRRPRRNSESSVLDFDAQPLTEEEKRMIEAKRRERDRQRRGEGKEKSKSGRPSRRMDIIDQLDATSIYGTGGTLT
ncbi:hypothetical protein AUP68_05808 [Ilyonectria robusta]